LFYTTKIDRTGNSEKSNRGNAWEYKVTKFQRIMLFFLLFSTMLIFGLIENFKGVSFPLIKTEFNASWEQQGLLVSLLSLSYVVFSIIAGVFLGRFGIKPSFLLGFTALSIGLFSLYFMPSFLTVAVSLFLLFAGFGFFEIGINALASRVFVKKAVMLMNLLHGFYGIGAIIGPKAAGIILTNNAGSGWRFVYLLSLPLALILFFPAAFAKFPEVKKDLSAAETVKRINYFDALRNPMVWLIAIALGFGTTAEMSSANWGALYFQDVYGLDPRTSGAAFLSIFFICFPVSRLVCGILLERIGYMRSLIGIAIIVFVIFITGFCLGARGIYVLPVLGFFIGPFWPTMMAVANLHFGKDAPVMSSAIIAIGGTLFAGLQFLVGLTNRFFGPAWGYRSSLVYTLLLIAALIILGKKLKNKNAI
jgi:fucose permease